jgi:diguanylate cyclase (GGDEF)-like protein
MMLLACGLARAQTPGAEAPDATVEVEAAGPRTVDLSRWARVWPDPSGRTQLDQVRALPASRWQAAPAGSLNFGYSHSAYWIHLRLHHGPEAPQDRLLGVAYPLLDELDVAVVHANGRVAQHATGDLRPFASRPVADRTFWFPVTLGSNETVDVYLRVQSQGSLQVPLQLSTTEAHADWVRLDTALQSMYIGTLLSMLLFTLLLAFRLRECVYAYYVVHIGVFGAAQVVVEGLAFAYLWPAHPHWHNMSTAMLLALAGASMLMFSRCFLATRDKAPRTDRLLQALQWSFAALALASLFLPYAWVIQPSSAAMVISPLLLLALTARLWWRGVHEARFFLAAVSGLVLGIMAVSLHTFGVLPSNLWTTHGAQFGSMLEAVFLSLALADRVRLMRDAQARLQTRYAQDLETQVKARTHELDDALHRLSEAHARLQAMAQHDPLTGLKNRAFLNERLPVLWRQAQREQQHLSVLMIDIDHFKLLNDRHGHAAGDEALRQVAHMIDRHARRPEDHAVRYGGEEFLVILPQTHAAGAAHIAEALRADLAAMPIPVGKETLHLTVSIGVAGTVPRGDLPVDALIEAADRLLYQAKHEGRNRCAVLPGALTAPPVKPSLKPAGANPVSAG